MEWFTFASLSAIFAALTAILAKVGMRGVDSNLATFIRVILLIPLALGLVLFQGTLRGVHKFSPTTWMFLALSAVATGISWFCYFRALQIGEVHKVIAIDKLSLVLTVLLGAVALKEHVSVKEVFGIVLMLMGTYFVTLG